MHATPREAGCRGYPRRDPTCSLLYELVRERLETFLDELSARAGPGLPFFVKRELRRYLECGVLAHGFARVHCPACKRDSLVAFSCKGRGFCPSCCGRRMSATAAHLVDHVLPETPMRQWVLTLPFPLCLRCAFDRELCSAVRRCFITSVSAHLARHARARGIPPGAKGFRSGAVNVIQRYGGALNLNVHFHALFIDGVYTRDGPLATARFHELPAPSQEDVEWTLARVPRYRFFLWGSRRCYSWRLAERVRRLRPKQQRLRGRVRPLIAGSLCSYPRSRSKRSSGPA